MPSDIDPIPSDYAALSTSWRVRDERRRASVLEDWIGWLHSDLDRVLALDDAELERRHDFIQWLFPLGAPSAVNPKAPVIGRTALRACVGADPFLREALLRSWARMLAFYGLAAADGRISWSGPRRPWALAVGHNDRRISRMLHSMHSAGFTAEPAALLSFLEQEFVTDPRRSNALSWWRHQLSR